jgi:oligopeptide transport system substrate-binding protein
LEAYRSGNLDVVELNLDILESGRALAKRNRDSLVSVSANHLDYFCMNLEKPPYNDPDLRMALALSIDRNNLVGLFQGLATPAYGFTPPTSAAYQGEAALKNTGFRYNPDEANRRFQLFLSKTGASTPIDLKLVYDGETMPELAAQYFKDSVEEILPVKLQLEKITWPELMQSAFGGALGFHRLWWLVATPSEDVYFQFFMPGKFPPAGLNISRYDRDEFAQRYNEVFSGGSEEDRVEGIRDLEQMLVDDAVAIPLWHRKPEFLIQSGVTVPIASTLRKFYAQSSSERQ